MPGLRLPAILSVPIFQLTLSRASVFPFQNFVNSVSGFAITFFYRFRFCKFRFLQIFSIPFNFFQAVFLVSMIFVRSIWGHSSVT